jgi:hypothetical protein
MEKFITVKGIGRISVKPDLTILSLGIETIDLDFDRSIKLAGKRSDAFRAAIAKSGLAKDVLKTSEFTIDKAYHYETVKFNDQKKVFDGWKCFHLLKVEFPHDVRQLTRVLHFVAESGVETSVEVDFSISDPVRVTDALLADAAKNARRKAETLCAALDAKLGKLVKIDYDWSEISIISQTKSRAMFDRAPIPRGVFSEPEIDPENIRISDSATFVWEIG